MDKARNNLTHYITMIMREQGLQVDADTYAELSEIFDAIEDHIVYQNGFNQGLVLRIEKFEKRMKRLELESEFNDHS